MLLAAYVLGAVCVLKVKVKMKSLSHVQIFATPGIVAYQAPTSMGFSRQEYWSGLPFPSPMHESEKWKGSRSVVSDSLRPHDLQLTRPPSLSPTPEIHSNPCPLNRWCHPTIQGTRLEKVSFHSNLKKRQCQRMLKLPHNCTHLTR